jgi:hypothetical protein
MKSDLCRLPGIRVIFLAALVMLPVAGCATKDSPYGYGKDMTNLEPTAQRTLLKLRAFQQTTDYTCGPSALLTLTRFYGGNGDEMQIAKETGCNKDKGTNPQQMVQWLNSQGFQAKFAENGSLDMLRENLKNGVPTLIEWIDWGGHWVIVVGYDTMGTETLDDDVLLFADPADCHDGCQEGLTWFNAQRFDAMWFDAFLFDKPMHKIFITVKPVGKPGVSTTQLSADTGIQPRSGVRR